MDVNKGGPASAGPSASRPRYSPVHSDELRDIQLSQRAQYKLVAGLVTYLRKVQMQRSTPHRVSLILGMLALGASQFGCSNQQSAAASSNGGAASSTDDIPAVLATVGNDKITLADVRTRVGDELD